MKTFALLATVAFATLFSTVSAQAASVGKLAGIYKGSGTVIDNRTAPEQIYKYIFSNVVVKVSKAGVISGSATVTVQISSNGSPFLVVVTQPSTAKGKLSKVKKTASKLTATGAIVFTVSGEDYTAIGPVSVAAKSGKGTLKLVKSLPGFTAAFALKK